MKINLLTVCTDEYPVEYARKLITRVQQVSNYDIVPYCITDRPDEVFKFAVPIRPKSEVSGWWHKVELYNDALVTGIENEWCLYMDLDIVVQDNFDEEIRWAMNDDYEDHITCVSDTINWMNNKFSSSWMVFKSGQQGHIYREFEKNKETIQKFEGGDQVWTGLEMKPKVRYIDEEYPNLKKNLKFHLGQKVFGYWQFPSGISPFIKLVDCGGRPKPHDLIQLTYIKENWHDI